MRESAQFLDVEVEEVTGMIVLVSDGGRLWGLEAGESAEVMAAQDAGESGVGDGEGEADLGVGATLAAEGEDLVFEVMAGLAGLAPRNGGVVFEALREVLGLGACKPSADGFLADAVAGGGGAEGEVVGGEVAGHLSSCQRGESGISVHVVRAGGRWV